MKLNFQHIFRNSYLALCILLLCCVTANGQVAYDSTKPIQKTSAYGYEQKNIAVWDSGMLRFPRKLHNAMAVRDSGAVGYRHGLLRYWAGSRWYDLDTLGGGMVDTTGLSNRINAKLNIADTANMRMRPIAGSNVTITGTYPDLTIAAASGGSTDTTSLSNRINAKANTASPTFTGSIALSSTTGGITLPSMTDAQMNAITPAAGTQVWNTTYGAVCTYTSDWGWWSNDPAWLSYNGWDARDEFTATGNNTATTTVGNFIAQVANSGLVSSSAGTANRPGIIQLSTSTSATAQARIMGDVISAQTLVVGGGRLLFEDDVQIPTLSNSTETFRLFTGYSSSGSAVTLNSIAFLYDSSGSSTGSAAIGRWQVVTSNGSSRTYTTTDSTVTAGQWYRLAAVVNAAGNSVQFYINGTLVRTETSTIPSGTMTPIAALVKTAGTTARTALIDRVYQRQKFTTAR